VVKFRPSVAVEGDKRLVRTVLEFSLFYVGGPSLSVRSGGTKSGTEYLVPHPFAIGENRVVSIFGS
jgi:hypothetical protein